MGTRGLMGFVIDDTEKLSYNHWDSYPTGLGLVMLDFARSLMKQDDRFGRLRVSEEAVKKVRELELVDENSKPTKTQQKKLKEYADTSVSSGNTDEWYVLLRECQGDPKATLESGFIIDSAGFAQDSLFCEWGYVIDLDEEVFEAYTGFVRQPHQDGRFADLGTRDGATGDRYHPIRLIGSWPLSDLPADGVFIKHCEAQEES